MYYVNQYSLLYFRLEKSWIKVANLGDIWDKNNENDYGVQVEMLASIGFYDFQQGHHFRKKYHGTSFLSLKMVLLIVDYLGHIYVDTTEWHHGTVEQFGLGG